MFARKQTVGVRAALIGAALCGFVGGFAGLGASSASAAKLGPYFPIPNGFAVSGSPKEALLRIQEDWLKSGVDNLKKARAEAADQLEKAKAEGKADQVAQLEEKTKKLDEELDAAVKELEIASDASPSHEVQAERKRLFLLNLNQWINELNRLATEQMKIAILKDGMEAQLAQNRNFQLSQQADDLEKLKHDQTIEDWAAKR